MTKYIKKTIIGLGFLSGFFMVSCNDIDPVLESMEFDRLFSPIGVTVNLNNVVELNLDWTAVRGADRYVVEIYSDSLNFEADNLVKTIDVETNRVVYTLLTDTRYSARIMAVGTDINDSKWSGITFATGLNNFLNAQSGDISSTFATLRWTPGETATKIILTPTKGTAVTKLITDAEIEAGVVKVEDLLPGTTYKAVLYSGSRRTRSSEIVTLPDGVITVTPADDLLSIINEAKEGAMLLLSPGEYLNDGSKIAITKNISIVGEDESNKPIIHAQLDIKQVAELALTNIVLDGSNSTGILLDHVLQFTTAGVCGTIKVEGCVIMNYNKSLISSGSKAVSIESIVVNNSVVSNILTSGADCIDIRSGVLKDLKLTNSTFNNCAPARDFIRLDDASGTYPGQVSNVLIDQCTLYKVSNNKSYRILYVRFKTNTLTVTNTIIAETAGYYTKESSSAQPECSKNNYFNAPGFLSASAINATAKYDISGTHTTLDPGFASAADGDFKLSNETLITNKVGDPRWR